ncbi:MAG TPA: nucleotidyl transferase AbiEii/AbiGii toxin family protein [Armatimonadota bacterium]|nr:nucleotidyl transferase AbiEii/AbiGii toxin family protein [Armatimonadota bacterium]
MIPIAYITEWSAHAPWRSPLMVEQDLVISRAVLELFSNPFLRDHLAFRGGTALYKLCLLPAARYSEDIDLVQLAAEPLRETMDHMHTTLDPWLGSPRYSATRQSARLLYRYEAETAPGVMRRVKIEINTREHLPHEHTVRYPFTIASRWVEGTGQVTSFALDELLGTKMRALYQRCKGRDLFDLDYALRSGKAHPAHILAAFVRYVSRQGLRITAAMFRANLQEKLAAPRFADDISPLLRDSVTFTLADAVERLEADLLSRLDAAWLDSATVQTV